ncbi:MAG: type II toxin-antitoxin system RelE/ParE family toxin [Ignavibacteriae bacterium]|nr:MAG: type II toxin-antitoxin system RelE/ParE family toxin [Ignavibacteriota bacterium]
MEYEIVFSDAAKNDLFDIYYYVALNDSFFNADKLKNRLIEKCSTLQKFPKRGHKIQEISEERPDILQVVVTPYCIVYGIDQNKVIIHAILDGRRDLNSVLVNRLLD